MRPLLVSITFQFDVGRIQRYHDDIREGRLVDVKMAARSASFASEAIVVDATLSPWMSTPTPGVMVKELHRIESHGASVLVRFDAGVVYEEHCHSNDEEYYVIESALVEGCQTHPAGTYVHHHAGVLHQPASISGTVFFVPLGLPPPGQEMLVAERDNLRASSYINSNLIQWQPQPRKGVFMKELARHLRGNSAWLLRLEPGASHELAHSGGAEYFVLEGAVNIGPLNARAWSYIYHPVSTKHVLTTEIGSLIFASFASHVEPDTHGQAG